MHFGVGHIWKPRNWYWWRSEQKFSLKCKKSLRRTNLCTSRLSLCILRLISRV